MVKRGSRTTKKIIAQEILLLRQQEEVRSRRAKRIFYIFLDIILLASFSLSLYSTYLQDYMRTVLFLAIGSLLLIFFILKRAFKKKR